MKIAVVNAQKCSGARCSKCLAARACERRIIIKVDLDEPAIIDASLCNGCGDCIISCEHRSIALIDA